MTKKAIPSRLRILMLSPQFRPIVGGYERAAERLSTELAIRGHSVTVIAERRDSTWPAREEQDGVETKRLWCLYRSHMHMATSLPAFALFLLTEGQHFQIWHVHQYGLHAALAVALGKLLHRPVVLKLTSSKDQGIHHAIQGLPLTRLSAWLLRRADAVVALSFETQEEAHAFGIPEMRIHLLGNGVNTDLFVPRDTLERLRLRKIISDGATGIAVAVGRLSAEKNLDGLLNAWQMAQQSLPKGWWLVVVGDGPVRTKLESKVQVDGLAQSVMLVGQQANIPEWLGAADVYVLSSNREGLSNSLLEAMSTGLPVVSTRVSGTTELLEVTGAGTVVDIGDMEQFAKALVDLATDPEKRQRMGCVGRSIIETRYSIDYIAEQHECLYRGLLGDVTDMSSAA